MVRKITPCLWFDSQAEEAARFYTSIFRNSRIGKISRYGKEGYEIHGRPEGTVMLVEFELDGTTFTALNGGPEFRFNEAISFQVYCETQEEVDYYWDKLSQGGDKAAQAVRVAQRQIRPVVAGVPRSNDRADKRPAVGEIAAGLQGDARDEEDRPCGNQAGVRRRSRVIAVVVQPAWGTRLRVESKVLFRRSLPASLALRGAEQR